MADQIRGGGGRKERRSPAGVADGEVYSGGVGDDGGSDRRSLAVKV
jgi:hypothetical protein